MKLLFAAPLLLAFAGGLHAVTGKTAPLAVAAYDHLAPVPMSRLSTPFLDTITLGFRGLYDDFALVWYIQMLAEDKALKPDEADKIAATVRQMTRHQPRIESLYMLSCFVLALQLQHGEYCEAILQDGMKALPESWRLPLTQGFVSISMLNDPEKGTLYYGIAATRPGHPEYLSHYVQKLQSKNPLEIFDLDKTFEGLLNSGKGPSRFDEILRKKP